MRRAIACGIAWVIGFACLASGRETASASDQIDDMFADRGLRHCLYWLLTGTRGALIEPLCLSEYEIPPPSLFLCARKVQTGFQSQKDLETCAVVFDEQAKKVRSGYVKSGSSPEM